MAINCNAFSFHEKAVRYARDAGDGFKGVKGKCDSMYAILEQLNWTGR